MAGMTDNQLRTQADALLRNAFGLLSQHTHGDEVQGELLAQAQSYINQALVRLAQLNERDRLRAP